MSTEINISKVTTEVIKQFNEAFRLHDAALLNNIIGENCVMEAAMPAPNGSKSIGKKECLAFWQQLINTSETQFTPEKVYVFDEKAIIFWRYQWAEGEENSVRGVNIMAVRDGLITEALGYVKGPLTV